MLSDQKQKQNKSRYRLNRTHLFFLLLLFMIGITFTVLEWNQKGGQILGIQDNSFEVAESPARELNDVYCCEVNLVEGEAEFQMGNAGWFSMLKGDKLRLGDSIRVLGKGKVNLVGSGTSDFAIRLGDDSKAKIVSRGKVLQIESLSGDMFFRNATSETPLEVIFSKVKFKVGSGAFLIHSSGENQGVFVYYGNVSADNDGKVDLIEQGYKYYTENKDLTILNKPIAFSYDELHEDSFLAWNQELDVKDSRWANQLGILGDLGLPFLTILEPENAHVTKNPEIVIRGETNKNSKIYINSKEVANKDGYFEYQVSLQPGKNKIEISSVTYGDVKIIKTLEVERTEVLGVQTGLSSGDGTIQLSGYATQDGINLTWASNNLTVDSGYYLLWSQSEQDLKYPKSTGIYLSSAGQSNRNFVWKISDGKNYYLRVCQFTEDKNCGTYSNVISVKAPLIGGDEINQINLELQESNVIRWSFNKPSKDGYFVVWSKNENPAYPLREGDQHYLFRNPSTNKATLDSFDGAGLYYVRVCQSLKDIKCGVYSNQITVQLN